MRHTNLAHTRLLVASTVLVGSLFLLFASLGHHALWDDEATTAMVAKRVWETGDTSAVVGHNIIAFRGGAELEDLKIRYVPPLQYYVAPPFVGLFGDNATGGRAPFAICGLLCVALMLWWLGKERASLPAWVLTGIGILGNVSFFLYFRQCRYYGLTILVSVAMAYVYLHWNGRRRGVIVLVILSLCLLASNYLSYIAVYCCLAVDYAIWGRHRRSLKPVDWAILLVPQVVLGGAIVHVWNPLGKHVVDASAGHWLADRFTLLWWNFRDLDRCEFGVGLLLLAAPLLYLLTRNTWLFRSWMALAVYVVAIALVSPQPVSGNVVADVRYLVPMIPLCVAIAVMVLLAVSRRLVWAAVPLGLLAFGTNLLHGTWAFDTPVRSTVAAFVGELKSSAKDSYTIAARWINENVPEGKSVRVLPEHMAYPLMFHAPRAVYAWQLPYPPEPCFKGLDPIHFQGVIPTDYLVVFGPSVVDVLKHGLPSHVRQDAGYALAARLDVYWCDMHRPELVLRSFEPVTQFDPNTEAVYIFRRVGKPPSAWSISLDGPRYARRSDRWNGNGSIDYAGSEEPSVRAGSEGSGL
jgi:hypothetical protein